MKTARHWSQMGETTFVGGIWALYWIHRLTGRTVFRVCLAPVVLAHWLLRPGLRAASLQYLRRMHAATPGLFAREPGWREGLRHVALFSETMLDKLLAMAGRYPAARVSSRGHEPIYQAALAGQGSIFVTAHMGCLELCQVLAEQQRGLKVNVLVHTRNAEAFNAVLRRLNPRSAVRLIEVTEIGVPTALMLAERLAAGECIAIAGDRVPVLQSKTVSVDFLGHAAPLPVGAYVLASLLKCPLHLLACVHEGDGYALHFETLAERVELPRGRRDQALQAHAQAFVDALTRVLRRSPYDWFNFFPFWDQAHES